MFGNDCLPLFQNTEDDFRITKPINHFVAPFPGWAGTTDNLQKKALRTGFPSQDSFKGTRSRCRAFVEHVLKYYGFDIMTIDDAVWQNVQGDQCQKAGIWPQGESTRSTRISLSAVLQTVSSAYGKDGLRRHEGSNKQISPSSKTVRSNAMPLCGSYELDAARKTYKLHPLP